MKWDTLQKLAGHANYQQAHELLESLLRGGWLEAEESREQGRWQPFWINFLDLGRMQAALGLPRRDDLARRFEEESARPFHDPRLTAIAAPLASQPPQRALDRLALLRALDGWIDEQRFGTRRDFALYARGGTKSLSEAQCDWLDAQLDLAGLGVQRHTPALWLRAPFTLCGASSGSTCARSPIALRSRLQRSNAASPSKALSAIGAWWRTALASNASPAATAPRMPCCGCPVSLRAGGWKV